jgi:hypothetical protein
MVWEGVGSHRRVLVVVGGIAGGIAGLWGKKAGGWMKAQIIFNRRSVE